jgi:PhnB protein
MAVKPIPEGYHTVTPFLAVDDATAAIEFYKRAFGARERMRMPAPDGKIAHAEPEIGDGATVTMPLEDMLWGDRFGSLTDPFGHSWSLATHKEDLTEEEIAERGQAAMAGMSS